jgi:predicted transcriptional regulator
MEAEDEKQITTIRLRKDLLVQLDTEAKARGWSRTILLEQVIAQFLASAGHEPKIRVAL